MSDRKIKIDYDYVIYEGIYGLIAAYYFKKYLVNNPSFFRPLFIAYGSSLPNFKNKKILIVANRKTIHLTKFINKLSQNNICIYYCSHKLDNNIVPCYIKLFNKICNFGVKTETSSGKQALNHDDYLNEMKKYNKNAIVNTENYFFNQAFINFHIKKLEINQIYKMYPNYNNLVEYGKYCIKETEKLAMELYKQNDLVKFIKNDKEYSIFILKEKYNLCLMSKISEISDVDIVICFTQNYDVTRVNLISNKITITNLINAKGFNNRCKMVVEKDISVNDFLTKYIN